jgi:UDP-2,3-diacylglucosamine pyrophosphatase LpxH
MTNLLNLLCVGDIHLKLVGKGDHTNDSTLFGQRVIQLRDQVTNYSRKLKADMIVVMGDVLHTHERLHVDEMNCAIELLDYWALSCPTIVLVGNHDMRTNHEYCSSTHWMTTLKGHANLTVVDKPMWFGNIVAMPYVYPGRMLEALDQYTPGWHKAHAILAHQEIYGAKMGAITSCIGDKYSEEFPLLISGHIHQKQWPQSNVYYTGSSLVHCYGDDSTPTIAMVCLANPFSDHMTKIKEYEIESPKHWTGTMQCTDNIPHIPPGTIAKMIVLVGSSDEAKTWSKSNMCMELQKKNIHVVLRRKKYVNGIDGVDGVDGADGADGEDEENGKPSSKISAQMAKTGATYFDDVLLGLVNEKSIVNPRLKTKYDECCQKYTTVTIAITV